MTDAARASLKRTRELAFRGGTPDVDDVVSPLGAAARAAAYTEDAAALLEEEDALAPDVMVKKQSLAMTLRPLSTTNFDLSAANDTESAAGAFELERVVSGHQGALNAVAVDASDKIFATGAADSHVKIFDLRTGSALLTLAGHTHSVRGLAFSPRHPYLFSAGEDKQLLCWDLETNQVVRSYFGHLSAVYSVVVHPTLDLVVSGGRDASVRVWDMRTRSEIHLLHGHDAAVHVVQARALAPQILSGSSDARVKTWDLVAGKCEHTLTHHRKGIRALALSKLNYSFVSGSSDALCRFSLPSCELLKKIPAQNTIRAIGTSHDDIISACDDGSVSVWSEATGALRQRIKITPATGSLASEAVVRALDFDSSGNTMVCGLADKTVQIFGRRKK